MMCSNWKISVFGIVALMLAFVFYLATTDTLAASQDPTLPMHQNKLVKTAKVNVA